MKVPQKCVLLFGFSDVAQILALTSALKKQGVRLYAPGAEDMGQPLGVLAGVDAARGKQGQSAAVRVPSEPMLLFCGLDEELDTLLPIVNAAGAGRALKAVLTTENRHWTPERLYNALLRERGWMS